MNSFVVDTINSHILCLSKHYMEEQGLLDLTLTGYSLGSSYCCQNLQKGGVWIFVRIRGLTNLILCFTMQNTIWKFVVELETKSSHLSRVALCRGPSASFNQFMKR